MTLRCECASPGEALRGEIAATLRALTKLQGAVDLVAPASLPNDGKAISDERNGR
jgi:phenylacetate-CoA ligase